MRYEDFIKSKVSAISKSGFDIELKDLSKHLFEYQKYVVKKALSKGKYAIFSDTGTGKTVMELEIGKQIILKEGGLVLIIAPLAVVGQTINEADKFGIDIKKYNINDTEGISIVNYDQIDNIDESNVKCIILDESSMLKNKDGRYRNKIIEKFKSVKYKYPFSATPSPNDPMELGNHAEFLNVMSYNEMLSMYFIHDAGQTQKWRLKGHAQEKFWQFVSSWAMMFTHPRDIGFEQSGYDLPKLEIKEIKVKTEAPQGKLFSGLSVNATDYNKSLRETEHLRLKETIEIVKSIDKSESIIIWAKQNKEAANIYKTLLSMGYDCRNVQGSDNPNKKQKDLLDFGIGKYQILITKQEIASMGMNYQNCRYQIFNSVDFSFEKAYQAMRRSWRYGQKRDVTVWMITTDRMINVLEIQKEKQLKFTEMQKQMTKATMKYMNDDNNESVIKEDDIYSDNYRVYVGDAIEKIKEIETNKAGVCVFSPPFADLYTYSDEIADMGNSRNYAEFEKHFKYLVPEISRVLQDGRICAVHCMDIPIQKGKEGFIGLRDFSGMLINMFINEGFIYHSRITIWKDPVVEMQRTKALGLLHKQVKKDSAMSRVGIPDYILVFRNKGENKEPIQSTGIPVDLWQKYASPVWYDINYTKTLNYRKARDNNDEKHIAPLQLDTIDRLIHLYSNKGDWLLSPFGGIGSEGVRALIKGRKSLSIELKNSYAKLNKKNHSEAYIKSQQPKLF